MTTQLLTLILGFAVLIKGADWLVRGASSFAKKLGVSNLVIGLTIVAFGTSAPELVVNIFAAIRGSSGIAIGNVLGSNISNILLVLGITSLILPLTVRSGTVWKEIPLGILAVVLVGILGNDMNIDGAQFSILSRTDGLVLLAFFIIFMYYIFGVTKIEAADPYEVKTKTFSGPMSVVMVLGGSLALALGGKWIIDSAIQLAANLHINDSIIGLTAVALGTSLPELATSVTAALKKDVDIAVGNIVGSNIFNIFWVLGLTSIIQPLAFAQEFQRDVWIALAAAVMLFVFMFIGRKHVLQQWQGIIFILGYLGYIFLLWGQFCCSLV